MDKKDTDIMAPGADEQPGMTPEPGRHARRTSWARRRPSRG